MAKLDLNTSPLSALVAEFNRLTGQNVKRFPDRKTAIKRLTAVLPKESAGGKGRPSPYGDKRIIPLRKSHPARPGTKRAAWLDALLSSSTVVEARSKVEMLTGDVIKFAVDNGYISLR